MPELATMAHAERIMERLESLAGSDAARGVNRVVFTDAHVAARNQLIEWAVEAGMLPTVDPIGNLWLLPDDPQPGMLLLGSHLDSVPGGGKFDGALGVVLALELASNSIRERGSLERKIAVVDFIAEESSRFGVGTVGSSVFAGHRSLEDGLALRDPGGRTFGDCRGRLWTEFESRDVPVAEMFSGYLEAHVDQASDLFDCGAPLGIVDAIAAPTRWRLVIRGQQAHSGAAPMTKRHDSLVAAAHLICWLEELARNFQGGEVRATVGQLHVHPNVANVVPGAADLIVDLRVQKAEHAEGFHQLLLGKLEEIGTDGGYSIELDELLRDSPVSMDPKMTETLLAASGELGITAPRLVSWSAHDALHVSALLPAAMVFVCNRGRISHSPGEDVSAGDVAAAYALVERAANQLSVGR